MYWQDVVPYLVGAGAAYSFSIGLGHWFVDWFYRWGKCRLPILVELSGEDRPLGATSDKCSPAYSKRAIPPPVTGFMERAGVTTVTLVQPEIALFAIGAWLTLKMAAQWNKQVPGTRRQQIVRARHAFFGLLSGALSCAIGWVGGLLGRLVIEHWHRF